MSKRYFRIYSFIEEVFVPVYVGAEDGVADGFVGDEVNVAPKKCFEVVFKGPEVPGVLFGLHLLEIDEEVDVAGIGKPVGQDGAESIKAGYAMPPAEGGNVFAVCFQTRVQDGVTVGCHILSSFPCPLAASGGAVSSQKGEERRKVKQSSPSRG
jgi:hypothetical protein